MTAQRIIVLIASHLNNEKRYETIKLAIKSLIYNTKLPDHVYISCSYPEDVKQEIIHQNKNEWIKLFNSKNINYTIDIQDLKFQQFGHLHFLTKYIKDDDIICFLDDDDLYKSNKIQVIWDNMKGYDDLTKTVRHDFSYFAKNSLPNGFSPGPIVGKEIFEEIEYFIYYNKYSINEFWRYSLYGCLFKSWFENCEKYTGMTFNEFLLKDKWGTMDMAFNSRFLIKYLKIDLDDNLMLYNIDKN